MKYNCKINWHLWKKLSKEIKTLLNLVPITPNSALLTHKKPSNQNPIIMNVVALNNSAERFDLVGSLSTKTWTDTNISRRPTQHPPQRRKVSISCTQIFFFKFLHPICLLSGDTQPRVVHIFGELLLSPLSIFLTPFRVFRDRPFIWPIIQSLPPLTPLAHRRDLFLFYRYFHGLFSDELASIIHTVQVPGITTLSH